VSEDTGGVRVAQHDAAILTIAYGRHEVLHRAPGSRPCAAQLISIAHWSLGSHCQKRERNV